MLSFLIALRGFLTFWVYSAEKGEGFVSRSVLRRASEIPELKGTCSESRQSPFSGFFADTPAAFGSCPKEL